MRVHVSHQSWIGPSMTSSGLEGSQDVRKVQRRTLVRISTLVIATGENECL